MRAPHPNRSHPLISRYLQGNRYNGKGQGWQGKGNGNGSSNASGKKGAAVRAFDVSDVAGPDVASILSGELVYCYGQVLSLVFAHRAETNIMHYSTQASKSYPHLTTVPRRV